MSKSTVVIDNNPPVSFVLKSPYDLPTAEEHDVLILVDAEQTRREYPRSREYYSPNQEEVLTIGHYYDGHWEDQQLNKVILFGWLPIEIGLKRG